MLSAICSAFPSPNKPDACYDISEYDIIRDEDEDFRMKTHHLIFTILGILFVNLLCLGIMRYVQKRKQKKVMRMHINNEVSKYF